LAEICYFKADRKQKYMLAVLDGQLEPGSWRQRFRMPLRKFLAGKWTIRWCTAFPGGYYMRRTEYRGSIRFH